MSLCIVMRLYSRMRYGNVGCFRMGDEMAVLDESIPSIFWDSIDGLMTCVCESLAIGEHFHDEKS